MGTPPGVRATGRGPTCPDRRSIEPAGGGHTWVTGGRRWRRRARPLWRWLPVGWTVTTCGGATAIPTVSVLAGRARVSAALLSRWAADRGRSLAWLDSEWPEPSELAEAWAGQLAAGGYLVGEAIAWLERHLDRPAGSLAPSVRGKTPFELAILLDRVLPSVSPTGVETACRWALCDAAERGWREDVGIDHRELGDVLESGTMASPCVHPGLPRVDRPRRACTARAAARARPHPPVRRGTTGRGRGGTLGRAGRPAPRRPGPRPAPPGGLPGAGARPARGLPGTGSGVAGQGAVRGSIVTVPDAEEEISAARSEGEPAASDAAGPAASPKGPAEVDAPPAPVAPMYDPEEDDRAAARRSGSSSAGSRRCRRPRGCSGSTSRSTSPSATTARSRSTSPHPPSPGGRDRRLLSLPGSRGLSPRPAQGPGASEVWLPGRPRAGRGRARGARRGDRDDPRRDRVPAQEVRNSHEERRMTDHPEISPIESLVLVRLLPAGEKGETTAKSRKTWPPCFPTAGRAPR